jgi:hypothetical protein
VSLPIAGGSALGADVLAAGADALGGGCIDADGEGIDEGLEDDAVAAGWLVARPASATTGDGRGAPSRQAASAPSAMARRGLPASARLGDSGMTRLSSSSPRHS